MLTNAFHCHVEKIDLCLYSIKYRIEYDFKTGFIQMGHLRECGRRWVRRQEKSADTLGTLYIGEGEF